jgi:hypothetical protein
MAVFVHVVTWVPVANAGILKSVGGAYDVPQRSWLLLSSASAKASLTPLVQHAMPPMHPLPRSLPRMPTPAMASVIKEPLKVHQAWMVLHQLPDLRPILPQAWTRKEQLLAQIHQMEINNNKRRVEETPHQVAVVMAIKLRLILQPAILRLVPTMSVINRGVIQTPTGA